MLATDTGISTAPALRRDVHLSSADPSSRDNTRLVTSDLSAGDVVRHARFGIGVVREAGSGLTRTAYISGVVSRPHVVELVAKADEVIEALDHPSAPAPAWLAEAALLWLRSDDRAMWWKAGTFFSSSKNRRELLDRVVMLQTGQLRRERLLDRISQVAAPAETAHPPPIDQWPSDAMVLSAINAIRRRRGDAILDTSESEQVLGNLKRRRDDPGRYKRWCWLCNAVVDEGSNEPCDRCYWLVCWCGACRAPWKVDARGRVGPCRREVWQFDYQDFADLDFEGRPILTSREPAQDADAIRALTKEHGVTRVFHWSPERVIDDIARSGLLAAKVLQHRAIPYVKHNYGSHEKEELLSAYVSVSLRPKVWMMMKWSDHPVVWLIDTEVLIGRGVIFLPLNSARSDVPLSEIANREGARAYRESLEALLIPGSQPEIYVPGRIPRAAVRGAVVPDSVIADRVLLQFESAGTSLPDGVEVADLRPSQ